MLSPVRFREHSTEVPPTFLAEGTMTNAKHKASAGQGRSPKERQGLIESAFPMIDRTAKALGRSLGKVRVEELIGIGRLEAVEAEAAFDPSRGVSFEAYVRPAVRGAMLDALRGQPSETSLDEPASAGPRAGPARMSRTPEDLFARRAARCHAFEALAEASAELPPEEQAILQRFYGEGEPLTEIATSLGVSHPTAKRWHRRALRWLRARLLRAGITDPIPSSRSV
jgi:RNA polymerase sigma factor (sigma-70 family)